MGISIPVCAENVLNPACLPANCVRIGKCGYTRLTQHSRTQKMPGLTRPSPATAVAAPCGIPPCSGSSCWFESSRAASYSGADCAPALCLPSKRAYVGLLFEPCMTLRHTPREIPLQAAGLAQPGWVCFTHWCQWQSWSILKEIHLDRLRRW